MTVAKQDPVLIILTAELVSHAPVVEQVLAEFAGVENQHQLLDRVQQGAVKLPQDTFQQIHVASYPSSQLVQLDASTLEILNKALKPSGKVSGSVNFQNALPALLSGFVENPSKDCWIKPAAASVSSITPVSLNRKAVSLNRKPGSKPSSVLPRFKKLSIASKREANDDSDDELIDENDLVDDTASLDASTIVYPAKCDPGNGKRRRRACKDCSCGLKEIEEQEVREQEKKQSSVIFSSNDISEVDFTVAGKAVGSCGSCSLGDAFRCDGCPYLGLPPFKPGEIVSVAGLAGDDF